MYTCPSSAFPSESEHSVSSSSFFRVFSLPHLVLQVSKDCRAKVAVICPHHACVQATGTLSTAANHTFSTPWGEADLRLKGTSCAILQHSHTQSKKIFSCSLCLVWCPWPCSILASAVSSVMSFPAPSQLKQHASKSTFFLGRKSIRLLVPMMSVSHLCYCSLLPALNFLLFILLGFGSYNTVFSHYSGCAFNTLLSSLSSFYEITQPYPINHSARVFPFPLPPSNSSVFFFSLCPS